MTVIITGAAGFIANSLIPKLLAKSDERIIALDNLHPQVHGDKPSLASHLRDPRVTFMMGDVVDPAVWDRLLTRITPRAIVHLAAETGTGQSLLESTRHVNVNVDGTAAMMDALSRHDRIPEQIILTSSRAVYGEGRWRDLGDGSYFYPPPRGAAQLASGEWEPKAPSGAESEFTPHRAGEVEPRPTNVYAATKLAQEHLLAAWSASFGVDLTVLRLQNVYGAGQAVGNPYTGVLTFFATQLVAGNPISVYEGGGIVRDFVHVSDVTEALVTTLEQAAVSGRYRTLDLGSGEHGTLEDFARILAEHTAGGEVRITQDYRLGDVRAAFASIDASRQKLGYTPKVPFEAWVRAQATDQ